MRTNILRAALFTPLSGGRWGLPLLCWGEPGVAKTSVIEEIAARFGLPCETLSPSERGEGAFGVVPVPAEMPDGGMVLAYPRPEWTARFDAVGRGLVFVDEATSTPPALQAPLMGLILARRIGGHILPPGVRVLAAANPTDQAAGGFDLAAPVANRVGHLDWGRPSAEEHVAYMLRGSTSTGGDDEVLDAASEEARVLRAWGGAWASAAGLETAFLTRRPELKNKCPAAGDPRASRAWPSDRSWEAATRAWASAEVQGLTEVETETFVAAFIGEDNAGELFVWAKEQDLPDPVALLEGKVTFAHNPTRLDRTVAVLGACTALVTPKAATRRNERAGALWGLLEALAAQKLDLDIVVPPVDALIHSDLHLLKEAAKTLARVQPVLKAANITPGRKR